MDYKRNLLLFILLLTFSSLKAQDCGCNVTQVENNEVESCEITYGTIVTVSTAQEFRSAINQANSSGGNMTILIEDGTYQVASTTSYPYITASNLVIRSASGNRDNVVLTGTGMAPASSGTENILFAVGNNIVIADLTVRDCRNHGIAVSGDELYVHNVKIQNTYEQMLKGVSAGDGADNGRVQCSLFEYTAGVGPNWYIGGIDVHEGQGWIVRDNVFRNIASPAERVAEHAVHFWNHSSEITVERNIIRNCDRGIGFGLGSSPASGGIIRNNMIFNDGTGLFDDVGIGLESCPDTKVYNNTIHIAYTNSIEYRFESTINVQIANNLTNGLIRSRNGGTATLTSNYTNGTTSMYINPSVGDLRLVSAIDNVTDAGTALTDVLLDIDQKSRSSETAPDIGAYEFLNINVRPLLQISDLSFAGGFIIPGSTQGASSANYAAGPIAYNAANHSLFVAGHNHDDAIAEFSIPELVMSENLSELNTASFLQDFTQVLSSTSDGNPENLDQLSGMCVIDGKLYVNALEYYDAPADNTTTTLVIEDPSDLSASAVSGFYKHEARAHAAGWISAIPEEWQVDLQGTYISGNSSKYPIASRHSIGPSAFVFDPSLMVNNTADLIPNTTLLDFSLANPLHSDFSDYATAWYNLTEVNGSTASGHTFEDAQATVGSNALWTSDSQASYGFIIPGTSTYLTIGSSGGHESGIGYKATQDNGNLCGGPCPYAANDVYNYFWLWDVNDFLKVKNGEMNAHEVRPYQYGKIEVPYQHDAYTDTPEFHSIVGGSFDAVNKILYLNIYDGGTSSNSAYGRYPAIAAYWINTALGEDPRDGIDNNGDGRIDEQIVNKWIGPSSGEWHSSPANWSCGHIPNSNNIVVIGAGAMVSVPEGQAAVAYSVHVSGGSELRVPDGASLSLSEE